MTIEEMQLLVREAFRCGSVSEYKFGENGDSLTLTFRNRAARERFTQNLSSRYQYSVFETTIVVQRN